MLKSLMLVSRAVDEVLEKRAVESTTGGPLAVSKVKLLRLLFDLANLEILGPEPLVDDIDALRLHFAPLALAGAGFRFPD